MNNENKRIIIDYLSGTFPFNIVGDEKERNKVTEYVEAFRTFLNIDDCFVNEENHSFNNYKYEYKLSEYIILRFCGPENDLGFRTCQFELKGEGCREFERLRPEFTWYDILKFLLLLGTRFRRIDITIDDLSGAEIKMKDIFEKIKKGYYTSVFKSIPKYHGMLDTGLTIDMGSRNSSIELCIYDKLNQQKALNKIVDYEYWTRYEMRFRQDKAHKVVMDLIKIYKDETIPTYGINLKAFAIKSLYAILDLKVDNNYNDEHQKTAKTEPKWLAFLENTEKGILPKADKRISSNESRFNYIMPKAKLIILEWILESNFDRDTFLERILTEELDLLKDTTRSQINRFNQYLLSKNKSKVNQEGFNILVSKIDDMLEEGALPF